MNATSSGNSVSFVFLFRAFSTRKVWYMREEQRSSMTKNVISIRNLIKSMWFLLLSKCRSLIRSKNSDKTMASIDKCVKNKASERASERTNERVRRRPRKKRKKCKAFHKVQFSQCLFDGKISFSFNFRKSCLKIDSLWFYFSVTFCFSLPLDNLRSFFRQSEQIFFFLFFFKVDVFICHSFRSDLIYDLLLLRWFTMMTVMFDWA